MVDKNKAMIEYLLQCPTVKTNPLFFNFGRANENSSHFITVSNDEVFNTRYIDGSILKTYGFMLLTHKTISYNAIVKTGEHDDENLTEFAEFQEVIDWIKEQEEIHNYPDFGEDCIIDEIKPSTENPVLQDVDTDMDPAIATYSVSIQVTYLDNSKKLWK